jgi:hypothetical protein
MAVPVCDGKPPGTDDGYEDVAPPYRLLDRGIKVYTWVESVDVHEH